MDTTEPNHISHKYLEDLTDGYSEERLLGRGAFGAVYRGEDKDGHRIAVKVLLTTDIEDTEFRREFKNLRKLNHPNIIRLVGFCSEDEELLKEHNGRLVIAIKRHRALCFEYMENGSLEKYISDNIFVWEKQFEIIKGICEGLKYLHMGLEEPMKHLDLKPGNILLDKNMVPKIADFGLSRLVGEENTKKTLSPTGSLGYLPPEFIMYQIISKEFDIFSLGVIILKIMIGARGYFDLCDMESDESHQYERKQLLVYTKWEERLQSLRGYTLLKVDYHQVKKCIEIALKCIQDKKSRRPNIGYIVEQLNEIEKLTNSSAYRKDEAGLTKTSSPDGASDASGEKPNARPHSSSRSTFAEKLPAAVLKDITNNFSPQNIRGQSVFGTIYEGYLPGGGSIAVKRLAQDSAVQVHIAFETEVTNLMAINHANIVKLLGFCNETEQIVVEHNGKFVIADVTELCLCYEYLPKGTIDKYIYDQTSLVGWNTRFQIIKGICQGLHFLHENGPLIHLNLVPKSIWLDDNWVSKIADFGHCRLFGQEQSRDNTANIQGQIGYMAPEYLYKGEISTMSDIYSLGMLILETTTGEKNLATHDDRASRRFVENIKNNWKNTDHITSKYPLLTTNDYHEVQACILIGLKCVEVDRNKRPTIVDIIHGLNGQYVKLFDEEIGE